MMAEYVLNVSSAERGPFSSQVDPFGLDKVDIPMEEFCETIEGKWGSGGKLSFYCTFFLTPSYLSAQVHAIDERSRSGIVDKLSSAPLSLRTVVRRATFHMEVLKRSVLKNHH